MFVHCLQFVKNYYYLYVVKNSHRRFYWTNSRNLPVSSLVFFPIIFAIAIRRDYIAMNNSIKCALYAISVGSAVRCYITIVIDHVFVSIVLCTSAKKYNP